jgi:hypothetical protein
MALNWKRLNYLVHRWTGITLGALVFVWFASGIVMVYYPWPMPTATEDLARLRAFEVPTDLVAVASARDIARAALATRGAGARLPTANGVAPTPLVGARLMMWNGRPVYSFWRQHRHVDQPTVLVDASTGSVVSPISSEQAVTVARSIVGRLPPVAQVELLEQGDYYLLSSEYQPGFPAYRVLFDDVDHTAVYVSREAGYVVGIVTSLTRWTTWLGSVPHWLYFKWLYHRLTLWLWVSYVLPAIAVVGGLAGIVLGLYQLFPRRRRGEWRVSAYHGVSKWHHISGIVFGALVVTWSLSGLLEVVGPDNSATGGQVQRVRGESVDWSTLRLSVADASQHLQAVLGEPVLPVAVDVTSIAGIPGYVFHLQGDRAWWVDGATGVPRGELDARMATALATQAVGVRAPVHSVDRITAYDAYYYARPHREMRLPAWRVAFADPEQSTVYLDVVSGKPVGFVNTESRTYRWLRDGLHSLDFPVLNDKRPLWDLVLVPLMLGGTVAAFTGVWLVLRRLRRMG